MARRVDDEVHFVNKPPEKYLCRQSPHILCNPVQVDCGHHFCRDCIQFEQDDTWVCTVCKVKVHKSSMTSVPAIKQGVLSLMVYCSYEKNGCTWTGSWRKHKDHLSTCIFREMVMCQVCRQEIPKCKQQNHRQELCFRQCPHCGKNIRTSLFKVHQFSDCPQRNVAGFAESNGKPRSGHACGCRNPCCSIYDVVHGVVCIQGVMPIPVCVDGKGKENLSLEEQAEEDKLEEATKDLTESFEEILTIIKELLIQYTPMARTYMSQKCPGGGDFFNECVHWYSLSDLKELVHIAFNDSIAKSVLEKIHKYEQKVDEFIVQRIVPCDHQVVCMKVDSQFAHIPAKVYNVDLLSRRVKKAVSEHTGREYNVWFSSAHQALRLELQDAVQCSVDATGAVDQNKASFDSLVDKPPYESETHQSPPVRPFIAPLGID